MAAGCPVVVKAHPAHPGTSELVGRAIQAAVKEAGLHEGVFSLLFGVGDALGQALVSDARIKAVGFTGSRGGGLALGKLAAARQEPIPVYAEMSSINPVLLLPGALAANGAALGTAFAGSLTMGAGQFCTNPGLLLATPGPGWRISWPPPVPPSMPPRPRPCCIRAFWRRTKKASPSMRRRRGWSGSPPGRPAPMPRSRCSSAPRRKISSPTPTSPTRFSAPPGCWWKGRMMKRWRLCCAGWKASSPSPYT
ncbi:aldehyde dehydrogenase family protein [Acidocella sp. MX-AZ03]|uniref:aldehyde dehydrogenase family protein n=1 Tax=Acidocella sp. MX-AZ03 TaxID=2697363 RepID=UPI003FA4B951